MAEKFAIRPNEVDVAIVQYLKSGPHILKIEWFTNAGGGDGSALCN
jgi:hypothetical protein